MLSSTRLLRWETRDRSTQTHETEAVHPSAVLGHTTVRSVLLPAIIHLIILSCSLCNRTLLSLSISRIHLAILFWPLHTLLLSSISSLPLHSYLPSALNALLSSSFSTLPSRLDVPPGLHTVGRRKARYSQAIVREPPPDGRQGRHTGDQQSGGIALSCGFASCTSAHLASLLLCACAQFSFFFSSPSLSSPSLPTRPSPSSFASRPSVSPFLDFLNPRHAAHACPSYSWQGGRWQMGYELV